MSVTLDEKQVIDTTTDGPDEAWRMAFEYMDTLEARFDPDARKKYMMGVESKWLGPKNGGAVWYITLEPKVTAPLT